METQNSGMPSTNSRVPSSGSTTQTRRLSRRETIIHALFREPALAVTQQILAQHRIDGAVRFGHGVVPSLVFGFDLAGSEAGKDGTGRVERRLNALQNIRVGRSHVSWMRVSRGSRP